MAHPVVEKLRQLVGLAPASTTLIPFEKERDLDEFEKEAAKGLDKQPEQLF